MTAREANFDGLVGPTHGYAGLSYGNVASTASTGAASSPRAAVLQGLAKMKALADLGLAQGVLPPHERPDVRALRRLGFSGNTDADVIARAAREDPTLLALVCSASAMWTANAATVAPSADVPDRRVHFTPANLSDRPHRSIEPEQTGRALRAVFPDPSRFVVHDHLAMGQAFADEGAANHTRLCTSPGDPGLHVFVYGRRALGEGTAPRRFPARQTLEASQAVARLHGLAPERTLFVQQSPDVIDEGVFHNDVISVGHERLLFFHERAFADRGTLPAIRERFPPLEAVEVRDAEVSVADAVKSYLFNSQILTPRAGARILVAPEECRETPSTSRLLDRLLERGVFTEVRVFDLRQSMRNGGGPACLRLRVVLEPHELAAVRSTCLVDASSHARLVAWAEKRYRDRLVPGDLADPQLLVESRTALDELTQILGVGSIYPFQLG
jgi:succinylarginine dihydrolase